MGKQQITTRTEPKLPSQHRPRNGTPVSREQIGIETEPEFSVVIPVYNEEKILQTSMTDLRDRLAQTGYSYEVILAENGSRDRTVEIGREYSLKHPQVQVFSYPEPNYGGALREGILRAKGDYVVCEEIDILDVDFHLCALELLRTRKADMVVGSKAMRGARDNRPFIRRFATRVYNRVLRITLGFRGTDTHGIKAFRRSTLLPVLKDCIIEKDVFASELVIRAERAGLRIVEIPVDITEKRAPSINLFRRVPRALANVLRLMIYIHFGRNGLPAPAKEPE
jgi:glycosyltransferase involved in cell wall biosynthesis